MFEKAKPPAIPSADRISMRVAAPNDHSRRSDGLVSNGFEGEQKVALPLRSIEWTELTARLTAARDLRQLLRDDLSAKSGDAELGFADAAAQFFRTNDEGERCVNPTALEARKASSGMYQNVKSKGHRDCYFANHDSADAASKEQAEPGDAREE